MSKAEKKTTGKRILCVISLCFVVLMTYLGFWQLDRAEQKERLLEQWHQAAVSFEEAVLNSVDDFYQKVRLSGVIDSNHYFFLDNRTREGRVGYELIVSMRLSLQKAVKGKEQNGKVQKVFVNLGWVPASIDRSILPQVTLPTQKIEIEGWVKKVGSSILLAEDHWSAKWPVRIQQVDVLKMKEALLNNAEDGNTNSEYAPLLFLAKEAVLPNLVTGWKPTNMTVEKHIGYAVQWFLMAIALVVLIVWFVLSESVTTSRENERGKADEGASS